jgi:CDP-glucose 4,6-dehydratase
MESLVLNSSFWKNRKVFLTGHTGFKGSWISLWLQHLGAEVLGYSLAPHTSPNLFESANVGDGMNSVIGDIRDKSSMENAICNFKPEIIIHMAAQPLVRESYNDPVGTFETNVLGTVNLLEICRFTHSLRAILNITTDKCYQNQEWLWGYRESDTLGGYDPYSSSKACSELISDAYRSSFLNSDNRFLATARAGNVIGGGDWAKDRLVPDLIEGLSKGQPIKIRNPASVRPWQHVLEPLHGYLLLAERLYMDGSSFAEAWNFGPNDNDSRSVSCVVNELSKYWDEPEILEEKGFQPHEAQFLKLDISKTRNRLGWNPQLDFKKAISLTADWHLNVLKGVDPREATMRQILSFTEILS